MGQERVRRREIDMPKCPRCESMNTKFCYYNNNSLTQPRYLCKTCKRHWTLGGTLRKVPFGGACRKTKNVENSSSYEIRQPRRQPQSHESFVQFQPANLTRVANAASTNPLYLGGDGYFSSLKVRSDVIGSSNLGFNLGYPASQFQILPSQFYQMSSREREALSLYMAKQSLTIPSNMANRKNNPTSHNEWTQNFINTANNRSSDAYSWSSNNTTYIGAHTERNANVVGSSPSILNQWPAFPGYGPVP